MTRMPDDTSHVSALLVALHNDGIRCTARPVRGDAWVITGPTGRESVVTEEALRIVDPDSIRAVVRERVA